MRDSPPLGVRMLSLRSRFTELEALYAALPALSCPACGQCCVEPHFSLLEFAWLIDHLLREAGEEVLLPLISLPLRESVHHPGDPACPIQDRQGRCGSYHGRGLACRLEGFPALEAALARPEPICPNHEHLAGSPAAAVDRTTIIALCDRLRAANQACYACSEEPWFCYVLPLQCWWAVAFDPQIQEAYWLHLRALLLEACPIGHLGHVYRDHSGLATMISALSRFHGQIATGHMHEALSTLRTLLSGHPRCGDYYQREGAIQRDYLERYLLGSPGPCDGLARPQRSDHHDLRRAAAVA